MKKLLLLTVIALLTGMHALAQDTIRFTWKGSTTEKRIGMNSTAGTNNITIDWGDGLKTYNGGNYIDYTHTYADTNNYDVTITTAKGTDITRFSVSGSYNNNYGVSVLDVSKAKDLTALHCNYNLLTELDVSNCKKLEILNCGDNLLSTLDLSTNTALRILTCSDNQLSALDISNNTLFTSLSCYGNKLSELDVSANTALTSLSCYDNQLSALDVSSNTALTKFWCNDNQFTVLDVSTNTALTELRCNNNQLTELDVNANTALTELRCDNNQLTELDVSNNTALTSLGCENNRLTTLDVSNHTALIGLNCQSNQLPLSELYPISKNKGITRYKDLRYQSLYDTVGQNQTIDLSNELAFGNPAVETQFLVTLRYGGSADGMYTFADGMLTFTKPGSYIVTMQNDSVRTGISPSDSKLTVTAYYKVQNTISFTWKGSTTEKTIGITATAGTNNITIDWGDGLKTYNGGNYIDYTHTYADTNNYDVTITTAKGTDITRFSVSGSYNNNYGVSVLDVSKAKKLTNLQCYYNMLTTLDVSTNTALTDLNCSDNQLSALNVSANTALTYLNCSENELSALDVSPNTALTDLNCSYNQLSALNVSANTALTYLSCSYNQLTELDVKANTALTNLNCGGTQLTELDVSNNTALTSLGCYRNQLTELDVNANTALIYLYCDDNQLTELDVSNNTALTDLNCYNNQLTTLDVSNHTALIGLNCQSNQLPLSELYPISKNKAITRYKDLRYQSLYDTVGQNQTIDLSSQLAFGNPVAQTQFTIALSNNGSADGMYTLANGMLTFTKPGSYKVTMQNDSVRTGTPASESALTVTAYYEVYDAIRLAWKGSTTEKTIKINSTKGFGNIAIDWGDGSIEYYDGGHQTLSHTYADDNSYNVVITADTDTELLELHCPSTELTALDVSQATALTHLYCYSNQLTALDVSANTALTSLSCESNQLTELDVSNNTELIHLSCHSNQLTALDVSNNTALIGLYCYSNQLTALNVSANTALTNLYCGGNQLTTLDISANTALKRMDCYDNQLSELNVSTNTALTNLSCGINPLTKLDVSANTALTDLNCSNNQLTELDISANTALTGLICNINELTELDVSTNTALIGLACDRNPLTKLDVSTNTALNYLYCNGTELAELDVAANTALINLQCANNRLTKLDVSTNTALTGLACHSNKLTSLDLSANTALGYLLCSSNKLTSLDLSSNTALTDLQCAYNILPLSELYKASNLISEAEHKHLGVQNHPLQTVVIGIPYSLAGEMDINGTLTAFVVTQNGNPVVGNIGYEVDYLAETITFLNYGDYQVEMTNSQIASHPYAPATVIMNFRVANDLIELTWQGSTTEKIIDLQSSSLPDNVWVDWGDGETNTYFNASIDMLIHQYTDTNYYNVTIAALETDAKFTSFDCSLNQITNLDVSHCTALQYIMCGYNQLTTLDVSNCTKLKHLSCSKNQLTTLDISNCAGLEHLSCDENQLTTLGISNCTELIKLSCDENQLTTLDISNCTELTHLSCARNQLTTLDISNCTDLEKLTCFINQLTTLDISNCLILEHLSCDSNRLSTLDISNCTELTSLMCTCNAIPLSILKGFSDAISDPEMKYLGTQTLAPQKTVQGEAFSLAGEMNINGTQTAFVITQNDSIVTEGIDYVLDYSAETITFLNFGSYQVAMTNSQIESHADTPAEVVINFEVRPIGTNANLATLSVSAGTLSPAFNADTTLYSVNVAYEVDEITISATTADTNATVAGTGARKLEVGETPCMIVVTAEDSTIIKAYAVVVTRANNVGIDELRAENEELRIYPNPTNGQLKIENGKLKINKVEVFNINGTQLSTINTKHSTLNTQEVDLSGFANGVYILRVNDKTTVKVIKE